MYVCMYLMYAFWDTGA